MPWMAGDNAYEESYIDRVGNEHRFRLYWKEPDAWYWEVMRDGGRVTAPAPLSSRGACLAAVEDWLEGGG